MDILYYKTNGIMDFLKSNANRGKKAKETKIKELNSYTLVSTPQS